MHYRMMMAALLLLLSGCATTIHDNTHCALIPSVLNGVLLPDGGGAACDNFLTSKPQTLNQAAWQAMELSWETAGEAVECTTSGALGDLKAEIEDLCSRTSCDYDTTQTILNAVDWEIAKMQKTASQARQRYKSLTTEEQ